MKKGKYNNLRQYPHFSKSLTHKNKHRNSLIDTFSKFFKQVFFLIYRYYYALLKFRVKYIVKIYLFLNELFHNIRIQTCIGNRKTNRVKIFKSLKEHL